MNHKAETVKLTGTDGWEWESNPGPQTWTQLVSEFDEILLGGQRGGAKSVALIAWMVQGDTTLDPDDPARTSFLNEPSYRGLLLRREYQGMVEFVDECADFFQHFGGTKSDDPAVFKFPSGAKIYTNHLGTPEAYEKYRGQGITRIGIEELTQIPKQDWYVKLFGSLRNKKQFRRHNVRGVIRTFPKLHCQIMSTTNPDGAGRSWVKSRFIKVLAANGTYVPPNTPMRDPITGLSRIFIPMRREDNPYLRSDKVYEGMLLAQDEITRKQWMDGDWDATAGSFFEDYRPAGPVTLKEKQETPWARHIPTEPPKLAPWWLRWGSLDIGYDHPSVAHKFCRNEDDRRIHVYDEFWARRLGTYELGVQLAQWWLPELEKLPDHQIVLYISPDAFSKGEDSKTKAELLELGIKEVLGPYGAVLLRLNSDERENYDPQEARKMFDARVNSFRGRMGIAIKMANDNVKSGCNTMLELLRWRPIVQETEAQLAKRLQAIYGQKGLEAYEKAKAAAQTNSAVQVLPKLLLWAVCVELDRCLKEAETDEGTEDNPKGDRYKKFNAIGGQGGDDALDSARYGCMGYKDLQVIMPREYFILDKMRDIQNHFKEVYGEELTDPTRLAMIHTTQNALYDKKVASGPNTMHLPRRGSQRHRHVN